MEGTAPRSNKGWFKKRDRRINREGRPRGSSTVKGIPSQDLAPQADRLKLLVIALSIVGAWLERLKSPYVTNLPYYDIVACRLDTRRSALVFTIRSPSFPRIAEGAPIPEFHKEWNGLMFAR